MSKQQTVAIDWDHCLFEHTTDSLLDGAKEAVQRIREAGHRVIIHSCNNEPFIREKCVEHGLEVDEIWIGYGKPLAAVYLDDRAIGFSGNWKQTCDEALEFVFNRPVRR